MQDLQANTLGKGDNTFDCISVLIYLVYELFDVHVAGIPRLGYLHQITSGRVINGIEELRMNNGRREV